MMYSFPRSAQSEYSSIPRPVLSLEQARLEVKKAKRVGIWVAASLLAALLFTGMAIAGRLRSDFDKRLSLIAMFIVGMTGAVICFFLYGVLQLFYCFNIKLAKSDVLDAENLENVSTPIINYLKNSSVLEFLWKSGYQTKVEQLVYETLKTQDIASYVTSPSSVASSSAQLITADELNPILCQHVEKELAMLSTSNMFDEKELKLRIKTGIKNALPLLEKTNVISSMRQAEKEDQHQPATTNVCQRVVSDMETQSGNSVEMQLAAPLRLEQKIKLARANTLGEQGFFAQSSKSSTLQRDFDDETPKTQESFNGSSFTN